MNKSQFKVQMLKHKETMEQIAELLDIHVTTLSLKLNGRTSFTQGEIQCLKKHWKLSAEDLNAVFFTEDKH